MRYLEALNRIRSHKEDIPLPLILRALYRQHAEITEHQQYNYAGKLVLLAYDLGLSNLGEQYLNDTAEDIKEC